MIVKVIRSILFLLLLSKIILAQSPADDLELIKESQFSKHNGFRYYQRAGNYRSDTETHRQNLISKYNPLALILKGAMLAYQHVISPQLSRNCPYEITCSNFSKLSLKEYGIFKGVFLSADRILRCNRIGILDVHPLDFNDNNGRIADSPNKYK